jgi:hypothetical protein
MNQLFEVTTESLAEWARKLSEQAPEVFVPMFLNLLEEIQKAKSEVYLPPPIAGKEISAQTKNRAAQCVALDKKSQLLESIFVKAFMLLTDEQLSRFRGFEIEMRQKRIDMLTVLLQDPYVTRASREAIKILALSPRPLEKVRLRQLLLIGLRNSRADILQIGLEMCSEEEKKDLIYEDWDEKIAAVFSGIECDCALDYLRHGKLSLKTAIAKGSSQDGTNSRQMAMQSLNEVSASDRTYLLRGLALATTDECIQSADDEEALRVYYQLETTLKLANFSEVERITVFAQLKYGETIISKVARCRCSGTVPWESSYDLRKLLDCIENIDETDWLLLKHIASARTDLELVLNSFVPPLEAARIVDVLERSLSREQPPSHRPQELPQMCPVDWLPYNVSLSVPS